MWGILITLLPTASAIRGGLGFRDRDPGVLLNKRLEANLAARHPAPELMQEMEPRWENDTYRYRSDKTEKFLINSLPEVNWDFGEMYSGLIPIDPKNESEALFWVFKPRDGEPVDEVTIWMNGGPGCSSLEGWFQENGPVMWQPGTYRPAPNPYSWDLETNMLWVEQPIGTGFSIGTPKATSEEEIAQDFIKFFKNFETTFGIKNYKIYVTGESYAGRYVPYISAAMIDANDTEHYDLSGILVYDPCIGDTSTIHQQVPAYPHIEKYRDIWGLNDTYMEKLKGMHEQCGYDKYIEKYLTYPAAGVQPVQIPFNYTANDTCDIFYNSLNAVSDVNPCFNLYEIVDHCPFPYDPMASPATSGMVPEGTQVYFQRADVLEAMHAPTDFNWTACSDDPVFIGNGGIQSNGDMSLDPIQHVLPQVIEHTNRVLVSNAEWDYVIITAGTQLAIQNMTWNGQLGFQTKPTEPFIVEQPDLVVAPMYNITSTVGQGTMGVKHYERGLMWVESFQAGHMQPQYQPRAALKQLRWMLGRIDDL